MVIPHRSTTEKRLIPRKAPLPTCQPDRAYCLLVASLTFFNSHLPDVSGALSPTNTRLYPIREQHAHELPFMTLKTRIVLFLVFDGHLGILDMSMIDNLAGQHALPDDVPGSLHTSALLESLYIPWFFNRGQWLMVCDGS